MRRSTGESLPPYLVFHVKSDFFFNFSKINVFVGELALDEMTSRHNESIVEILE
jgi:hypothetical protein